MNLKPGAVTFHPVDDPLADDAPNGSGKFYTSVNGGPIVGMTFKCPRCGKPGTVSFGGRVSWAWDGNRDKPTVSPSILHDTGKCGWHGYLRAGIWEPI